MKGSTRLKFTIIVVLLIVFFTALNLNFIRKEVKNFFYLISSPIQKTLWTAGSKVSGFFETITEMKELKKENEELKLKNQQLLTENISLRELKKENKFLRDALTLKPQEEFKLEMAEVIGKDISQDSILINKGSRDGISKDMPAITQAKILIGRVSKVYKNFSKVALISNKNSSFDAKIYYENSPPVYGVVKGQGELRLLLELIPKEKNIKEGDLVITAGLGGIYPKDLLIGKIKKVQKSDIKPFQKAEIKPTLNLSQLENLFIITDF